jgi:hypothetical protein
LTRFSACHAWLRIFASRTATPVSQQRNTHANKERRDYQHNDSIAQRLNRPRPGSCRTLIALRTTLCEGRRGNPKRSQRENTNA